VKGLPSFVLILFKRTNCSFVSAKCAVKADFNCGVVAALAIFGKAVISCVSALCRSLRCSRPKVEERPKVEAKGQVEKSKTEEKPKAEAKSKTGPPKSEDKKDH